MCSPRHARDDAHARHGHDGAHARRDRDGARAHRGRDGAHAHRGHARRGHDDGDDALPHPVHDALLQAPSSPDCPDPPLSLVSALL